MKQKSKEKFIFRYGIFVIGMIIFTSFSLGYFLGWGGRAMAAEADYCNNGGSVCIIIDELIPEPYKDAIQSYSALEIYEETPEGWTYMEFNVTQLPQGMTPQVLLEHVENMEDNLRRNRAQTATIPLIYPQSEPAPLCLRDSNGNLNGIYSVNGQLQMVTNDAKCFGICNPGDPCPPSENIGGNNAVSIN